MAEQTVISCPACQKKFKGKGDLTGRKIKCPFCSQPFVVPAAETVPPASQAQSATPPGKPLWDDDDGPAHYDVKAQDLTPRCPHCAKEMLSEKAVICVYCGYNTLTRTMGQTTTVIAHTFGDFFWHLLPGMIAVLVIIIMLGLYIWYCTALWAHESLRFWPAVFILGISWRVGMFAYKRFILEPVPPEKVKDTTVEKGRDKKEKKK